MNEHFPFGLAAGVGGYVYQQVTNDHGSGDQFSAFRGRVAAVGPLLGYTLKAGAQEVDFSARWFQSSMSKTGSGATRFTRPSVSRSSANERVYGAAPSCVHAFDPPRRRSFGREIGVPAPMTGPLVLKCPRQSGKSLYLDFFRPQCWIDVRARE